MIRRFWSALLAVFNPRATAGFLALSVIVGVFVGLAAAALIGGIEGLKWVVEWVGHESGIPRIIAMLAVPIGLLVAWTIAERFAPEVAGDGVPEAMAAVAIRSGYMPTRSAPLKVIATSFTVGLGGAVGREGPIVQVGAAIGSSIARHTGLGEDRVRSLVAAGAGAAIGASFNAPIAGMLFAMEIILGNFAVRHLNAVVVTSVTAAVTTRLIVREEQILRAFPHGLGDPRDLVLYALLGLLAAVVGYAFLRALSVNERIRTVRPGWLRPVALGLAVGAIGIIEPEILGTGQETVGFLLDLVNRDAIVWWSLLALVGWKILAATLTLGAGGFGGVFMPSLFIGAALGAAMADLIGPVWGPSNLSPGAFAVVGMAATFAAVARAPLTSILIVFEITGDYGLVLPLMLAASLATLIADRLHPDSVYQAVLHRQGIRLTRRGEVDVLDTVQVGDVASKVSATVDPAMTTGAVQGLFDRTRHHGLPVVDGDGHLVGVITITDIMRTGGPSDQVVAADAMTPRPVTVTPDTPVSVTLERMAALGVGRIPVVDEDDPTSLLALFRREDAVTAYHLALEKEVVHEVDQARLKTRTDPGAGFQDIEVPIGSIADGRPIKQSPIPGGVTIVSVRRGLRVTVPDGNTVLRSGDVLTVFSSKAASDRLMERLRGSEETTAEHRVLGADSTARFFDLEVPSGSVADQREIKALAVPSGCTVVSVRRGLEVMVPDGSTVLMAGDVLTVFAVIDARTQFAERLRAASEDA
ncbi:chloride channel protein [bacterium]|nr:chloride channel protein [bacterium]